jgi:acyl-CoA thioester hydrolase
MDGFKADFPIRWSDIDANNHVRYSVYIDYAADLRYQFFIAHGFPPEYFTERQFGPVYTDLEVQFLREVRIMETITISFRLAGMSPSGSYWRVHHDIAKSTGKIAAILRVQGAFFDLVKRQPIAPPAEILDLFQHIPQTRDFEILADAPQRTKNLSQV